MNFKDFMTSEDSQLIVVPGIGKMRLTQAKARVVEMLGDLVKRIEQNPDQMGWETVDNLLKRGTLQAYVSAIVEATRKQN